MEIGSMSSMSSMAGMMGMQGGMQSPPPPPEASSESSDFADAMDADSDDLVSQIGASSSEASDSSDSTEELDPLDTNEDGFVSQEELDAGRGGNGLGGIKLNGGSQAFQQLMDMTGGNSGDNQAQGVEQYGRMQDAMFGGDYNQSLSTGLDVSA
nr:hypothetical protein [uncultured Pseudodesulfovibrio sp.]